MFNVAVSLFTNKKNKNFYDLVEFLMSKIRILLVLDKVKIDYFITNNGKNYARKVYDTINGSIEYNENVYNDFLEKIDIIKVIKSYLNLHDSTNYVSFYEVLYWALTVSKNENAPIQLCKDKAFCTAFIKFVFENKSPVLINGDEDVSNYMSYKKRFYKIAEFFESYFDINLNKYIEITKEFKKEILELDNRTKNEDCVDSIEKLHLDIQGASNCLISEIVRLVKKEKITKKI